MKAIVSEDSEQSIANEDTLRLMRNNGISPPTVASIRPKMWTEVSGCQSAPPVLPTLYYVFCAKLKFIK
jgi:hypothetical protein